MKIMLFGTKILLPADGEYSGESCSESRNGSRCSDVQDKQVDQEDHHQEEEHLPKPENEESNSSAGLKKPDKILPCPRCKSSDTKFCYYNNYNISQPRHFCKGCQRYWTDGGTMRNVPVGAGRRKSKNYLATHSHHLAFSEARTDYLSPNDCKNGLPRPVMQNPNGYQHPFVPFTYPTVYPLQSYFTPWQSVTQTHKVVMSSETGSALGKRSRIGELLKAEDLERPRTNEAAKISVSSPFISRESLLKALQNKNKGDERKSTVKTLPLIRGNPAALSRSISFREGV